MVKLSQCFFSLVMSATYVALFIGATIYLVVVNRCKFNKRTKVVISILTVTNGSNLAGAILTEMNQIERDECSVYPLTYTMQAQQNIVILIIYSFLVSRMLAIYYKMQMVT